MESNLHRQVSTPTRANVTRRQVTTGQPATKGTRRERLARPKDRLVPLKIGVQYRGQLVSAKRQGTAVNDSRKKKKTMQK